MKRTNALVSVVLAAGCSSAAPPTTPVVASHLSAITDETAGVSGPGAVGSGGTATGSPSSDAVDCKAPTEREDRGSYCCASADDGQTFPHIQEAYCRLYCDSDDIYCVNERGDPLDDDVLPGLWPGRQVIVRVVARKSKFSGKTVVLTGSDRSDESHARFDAAAGGPGASPRSSSGGGAEASSGSGGVAGTSSGTGGAAAGQAGAGGGGQAGAPGSGGGSGGAQAPGSSGGSAGSTSGGAGKSTPTDASAESLLCTGACEEFRIASYEAIAPSAVRSFSIRLAITDNATGAQETVRTYVFSIARGLHYFEAGIMFPITLRGSRSIELSPDASTGLSTLEVDESLSWAMGVGVLIFPVGVYDGRAGDPRAWGIRHFAAPWGLGLGTNVFSSRTDQKAFTEAYVSLNYRFDYGAILGVGVSAVPGEFTRRGWSEGMILPDGTDLSSVTAERYMFRPHLTLTLSPEVLGSLFGLLSEVRSTSDGGGRPQAGSQ